MPSWSVMANASSPRRTASSTSSSGCEAPWRKLKLEWQCSSAYGGPSPTLSVYEHMFDHARAQAKDVKAEREEPPPGAPGHGRAALVRLATIARSPGGQARLLNVDRVARRTPPNCHFKEGLYRERCGHYVRGNEVPESVRGQTSKSTRTGQAPKGT
jgi:hypothetical protein